ncbi:MAG: VWA domain-containing protein [Acidobacteriota bacterium]
MRITIRRFLGGALLALALTLPSAAQEPGAQEPDLETPRGSFDDLVEISEVLLDVLVTDREGKVVVDLGPEDFAVIEGGERRPVTGASFYSNRFAVEQARQNGELLQPAAGEVLADRHFIFYFQDARRLDDPGRRIFRRQRDAVRQAKRWVEEEMLGGDWVAIVGYDVKLKVFSDFTQDREQLTAALDRMSRGKDPQNSWPSRRGDDSENPLSVPSLLSHLPEGKSLRDESESMYDGLSLVAEATRDIVGRKNLMLFSLGFGEIERIAGFGLRSLTSRPDGRFYPGLQESLNDNNVAVYAIDLVPGTGDHAQADFLSVLADDSGGRYLFNFVNFMTPIRAAADEASGYYLLSYQAEHPRGEVGYREVEIETVREGFEVRARGGYRFGS